jgi:uncharacterized membrane protein YbhN (UPF0104 family)
MINLSMTQTLKQNSIILIKLTLVGLIFWWLLSRKYLDLSLLNLLESPQRTHYLALAVGSIWLIMVLQALRARSLFLAQEHFIPLKTFLGITWIGYFFSTFLPGGVTSDLVKYTYFQKFTQKSKSVTGLLVLLDRVCGLFGLFILVFLVALGMLALLGPSQGKVFEYFGIAATLMTASVVGGCLLMMPPDKQRLILGRLGTLSVFKQLTEALDTFRSKKRVLISAIILSLATHLLFLFCLYALQAYIYEKHVLSMSDMVMVFPFAMLASATPISPQGVGLTQLVIISVASFFGFQHASSAVTLYTLGQMVTMMCFLSGFIPYLAYRKHR